MPNTGGTRARAARDADASVRQLVAMLRRGMTAARMDPILCAVYRYSVLGVAMRAARRVLENEDSETRKTFQRYALRFADNALRRELDEVDRAKLKKLEEICRRDGSEPRHLVFLGRLLFDSIEFAVGGLDDISDSVLEEAVSIACERGDESTRVDWIESTLDIVRLTGRIASSRAASILEIPGQVFLESPAQGDTVIEAAATSDTQSIYDVGLHSPLKRGIASGVREGPWYDNKDSGEPALDNEILPAFDRKLDEVLATIPTSILAGHRDELHRSLAERGTSLVDIGRMAGITAPDALNRLPVIGVSTAATFLGLSRQRVNALAKDSEYLFGRLVDGCYQFAVDELVAFRLLDRPAHRPAADRP